MADVKLELEQTKEDSDSQQRAGAAPSLRRHRRYGIVAALGAILLLSAGAWLVLRSRAPHLPPPQLVPLTTLNGWEWEPTFSPDGEQVAFKWSGERSDNDDIYVKMIGSSEVLRLTTDPAPDGVPSWSPDGRQIAFVRVSVGTGLGRVGAIHFLSPLGGSARQLGDFPVPGWGQLSWSADGEWLASGRPRSRRSRDWSAAPGHLASPRFRGRASARHSGTGAGLRREPCLLSGRAPPGVRILRRRRLLERMRLQVLDLDAGRVAAGSPRRLTHHGVSIPFLAWTRDGASIVYSANEEPYFFHLCGHRECGEVTSARPFFFTAGMNA